jgi:hypothetical protein
MSGRSGPVLNKKETHDLSTLPNLDFRRRAQMPALRPTSAKWPAGFSKRPGSDVFSSFERGHSTRIPI